VNRPSVSFLITNLNGARRLERTLPRLLESVGPAVFREEYELQVVDAGSTDDSLAVIDRFARTYGNTDVQTEVCSRGRGRQLAFERSHGAHLAVLDSDTFVRPYYGSFLRGYLSVAEQRPEAVVAYEEMDGVHANLTCSFFPRATLEEVGGWRDLWGAEDIDLWVRLVRAGKLRFLPVCLAEDLDHATRSGRPGAGDYRTQRERRYATGLAFYARWIRQTYGRYVGFAYSFREKMRYDWERQPNWSNRLEDLAGSAVARLRFFLGHPAVVRLDPARHNGYALFRYLLDHIARPSEFGLDDALMEIRASRMVTEFVSQRSLDPPALALYQELKARGRVIETPD
jgi:glycosyltransferase involved in cell wall biosynthesis